MLTYKIIDDSYTNIKEVLKSHFNISNRLLSKLKKENKIFLNGKSVYVTAKLELGDFIEIDIDFIEVSENIVPTKMNLDIIYEDDYMIIINKPAGIPIHPSMSHFENTISNGVQYYFNKNNIKRKIRPVNRLDKDTSGLVIFAKNEFIQESLIKQMKNKTFVKEYLAIVKGHLENFSGTINKPIKRKSDSIIEREISDDGDISITHYNVIYNFILKSFDSELKLSLVKFKLETGRTHQIRIHSKYIGHPLLGDYLYGKASDLIKRQALHAYKINFIHPVSKKNMLFKIKLPQDFEQILNKKRAPAK